MGQYDLWPPRCRLNFYRRRNKLWFFETDRFLDLYDTLILHWHKKQRTIYFGLSTKSTRWQRRDDVALQHIEDLIRYDLTFDGDKVRIKRVSKPGKKCTEEFLWKLVVTQLGY